MLKINPSDDIYEVLETLHNEHIDNKTVFGLDIDVAPGNCL